MSEQIKYPDESDLVIWSEGFGGFGIHNSCPINRRFYVFIRLFAINIDIRRI
jgi:hypothetical protein